MGFKVDYSALDMMYYTMYNEASKWNDSLNKLAQNTASLKDSTNMSGDGADSVRLYLDAVHNTILASLLNLVKLHMDNCLLYKRDYMSNVDDSVHALIDESEIKDIKDSMGGYRDDISLIDETVQNALKSVSSIISVKCYGATTVNTNFNSVTKMIDELGNTIGSLENTHSSADFNETQQMITALTSFIKLQQSNSRDYKTSFSLDSVTGTAEFLELARAYVSTQQKSEEIAEDVTIAANEESERVKVLKQEQEEYEKRKKQAETEKWIVTGACVIGSITAIVVIVGTGGTATPLVVGAVSAASGAVMAGNNAAADQYVESGQIMPTDWGEVGSQALLGGVSGFITGYVGAGVGGYLTNTMTSAGSTFLNSSSMAVRIGSNAVIGSTSQMVSGMASRGATTFVTTTITTGDVSTAFIDALHASTDAKSILVDVAIGGVTGGIKGIKEPPKQITDPKQITKEMMETKPKNSPSAKRWLEKEGGKLSIESDGTWVYTDSDGVTVRYENGYPNFKKAGVVKQEVKIDKMGDYADDFSNADDAAAQRGTPRDAANNTWHHSEDGKHMQEIDKAIHKKFTHRGGMSNQKNGIQVKTGLNKNITIQEAIDLYSEGVEKSYPGVDQYFKPDFLDDSGDKNYNFKLP